METIFQLLFTDSDFYREFFKSRKTISEAQVHDDVWCTCTLQYSVCHVIATALPPVSPPPSFRYRDRWVAGADRWEQTQGPQVHCGPQLLLWTQVLTDLRTPGVLQYRSTWIKTPRTYWGLSLLLHESLQLTNVFSIPSACYVENWPVGTTTTIPLQLNTIFLQDLPLNFYSDTFCSIWFIV